jgi:hypothetical protein
MISTQSTQLQPKLRVPKVAYCCFSIGQISPFYGVTPAEIQLKKVIYGLSFLDRHFPIPKISIRNLQFAICNTQYNYVPRNELRKLIFLMRLKKGEISYTWAREKIQMAGHDFKV